VLHSVINLTNPVCFTDLNCAASYKVKGKCGWNNMVRPLDLASHIVSTTFSVNFFGCTRKSVKPTGLVRLITECSCLYSNSLRCQSLLQYIRACESIHSRLDWGRLECTSRQHTTSEVHHRLSAGSRGWAKERQRGEGAYTYIHRYV